MKNQIKLFLTLFFILNLFGTQAFSNNDSLNPLKKELEYFQNPNKRIINFNVSLQLWNVVSLEYPVGNYTPIYDIYLRRARFGASGKISPKFNYNTTFSYDGIGKDSLTQSLGILNNDQNFRFAIRDCYLSYEFNHLFNFTLGYFRPRVGKETFNSSWFCISQEKSLPNLQVRTHLLGRPIGRETGINIGGFTNFKNNFHLLYDFGIFESNFPTISKSEEKQKIIKTGRVVLTYSKEDIKNYSLIFYQSGFGKRRNIELGFNASHQGEASQFKNNTVYGIDFQLNYGPLDVVLEQDFLYRENKLTYNTWLKSQDAVNSLKLAWNFLHKNSSIIQPTFMISSETADGKYRNQNPYTKSINQFVSDLGINWLLNKDKLKLGLHYIRGKIDLNNNKHFSYINASIQFML